MANSLACSLIFHSCTIPHICHVHLKSNLINCSQDLNKMNFNTCTKNVFICIVSKLSIDLFMHIYTYHTDEEQSFADLFQALLIFLDFV